MIFPAGLARIGRSTKYCNMNTTSIQKVETSKFARADLEYKLLMVDDDMVMKALPQTSYIKTMVTNEGKMDIESKGKQSVQRHLYVRFMCFGNGSLSSLYDKSQGFYRRQIILYTKDNLEKPLSANTFKQYLSQNAEQYGLEYSKHIHKYCRGYRNIVVQINPERDLLSNNIWNV